MIIFIKCEDSVENTDQELFSEDIFDHMEEENKEVNVSADEMNNYLNQFSPEVQVLMKKYLSQKGKEINIDEKIELAEEDMALITSEFIKYIKLMEQEIGTNKINSVIIQTDNITLREEIVNQIEDDQIREYISKAPLLKYQLFDANNDQHVRLVKQIENRKDVLINNPDMNNTLEKAKKSTLENGYYVCYDKDQVVGLFSIYNMTEDAWSFFFLVSNEFKGKRYGIGIIMCILCQLASLSNKNIKPCSSVFSLVHTNNIPSIKIMKHIANQEVFHNFSARGFSATKFDITTLYNSVKEIISRGNYILNNQMSDSDINLQEELATQLENNNEESNVNSENNNEESN